MMGSIRQHQWRSKNQQTQYIFIKWDLCLMAVSIILLHIRPGKKMFSTASKVLRPQAMTGIQIVFVCLKIQLAMSWQYSASSLTRCRTILVSPSVLQQRGRSLISSLTSPGKQSSEKKKNSSTPEHIAGVGIFVEYQQ